MYYQGTTDNIQAHDGNIQTLYLMNPNYIQGYTDTQQHHQNNQQSANMVFLNSTAAGNALNTVNMLHAPLQHLVGVPLPPGSLHDQNHHGLIQRLWGQSGGGNNGNPHHSHVIPSSTVVSATTTDLASQLGFQRAPQQHQQQGGLSLSLSPQHQQISFTNISAQNQGVGTNMRGLTGTSDEMSGMILGSKYLKAAQELLDEVVNVGKNMKEDELKEKGEIRMDNESMGLASVVNVTSTGGESSSKQKAEVTTAQRQELQMKKAKLVTMLEEVEQRYRQYHQQMQIIVSTFEQVAGIGSAKSYTQLALHAISKQFRCLKDAIGGQIKATSKSLGEEEGIGGKIEGSRLKYVDHHLRQQRALQQLGMMQPNAWRPQRGLPERAVSVLRAWLFEHFLHPYPKDSDKILLAKQTGLTRSQVSNWFINARVRLWKPMVEEMYLEEVKNQEQSTTSEDQNKNNKADHMASKSSTTPQEISTSTSPTGTASFQAQAAGFSFIGSLNMENSTTTDQKNSKKPRNHDMYNNSQSSILSVDMQESKAREESANKVTTFNPLMAAYTMEDHFGRFNPSDHDQPMPTNFHGNCVSLTLGLPPSENLVSQHNFLNSNHNIHHELGRMDHSHYNRKTNPQPNSHPTISFDDLDFQSGKRFSSQLLPDFVT